METVNELFYAMKQYDKNPAVISRDETVTYEQLIERSCKLASGLKKVLEPGDKIAVWLPNSIDWIIIELAAGLIGATVVTLNLRYKVHELTYILQHSKSRMFVFQPELENYNYAALVEQLFHQKVDMFPHLEYIVSTEKTSPDFKIQSKNLSTLCHEYNDGFEVFEKESSNAKAIYNMLYTSGTTSSPKGVMLSQRTVIKHSYNAAKHLRINSKDVVLGALPFCGIFGFNTLFASLTSGACLVPMERYKPFNVLKMIEEFQCTVFNGVDGMITPFFDEEELNFNLSSIRIGAYAIFSSNNQLFIERTSKIFPKMTVVQAYGMTEVGSLLFIGHPDASIEERSLPGGPKVSSEIDVDIVDKDTGVPLKNGEEGEIVIGGYSVMAGYYANPEKTKESFAHDGKFKTGDLGMKLADGSIVYKGRLREAFRLKGFLVSPKEIEDYICLMSEIDIVQIVQVAFDEQEQLVAFIKVKEGYDLSENQVFDYCKEGLADFKCPQAILFVNEFPTTAGSNGEKIQKNKLEEIAKEKLNQINPA
jgi:fatty-acyl-CoA synthase